ncbi:hypothetical protein [Vibrio jasicida]|uniref:hypothetical protein n=1 Tax=Vibrio jasicida TaxID=766224 RepID=UPI0005EF528A|nr:hypothetical protein [Vibrio jasicida]
MNHYAAAKGRPFAQQGKNQYRASFRTLNGMFTHCETLRADDIREAQKQALNMCTAYGCTLQSLAQQ